MAKAIREHACRPKNGNRGIDRWRAWWSAVMRANASRCSEKVNSAAEQDWENEGGQIAEVTKPSGNTACTPEES